MHKKSKEIEIEIFKTLRKQFAVVGLIPNQQKHNHREFNNDQMIFLVVCATDIIQHSLYIVLDANNIDAFMDPFISLSAVVAIMICFISLIFKYDELHKNIELCGNELTDSKCKCLKLNGISIKKTIKIIFRTKEKSSITYNT